MSDRETLLALAAQCEAAEDERGIRDVFIALHKASLITDGLYDRACELLNVRVYESAALTLVPEGWLWDVGLDWSNDAPKSVKMGAAVVTHPGGISPSAGGEAATPALALCVAALRARAEAQT